MSDDLLQFIRDKSRDRFVTELTEEFRNELDKFDNLLHYQSLDADQLKTLENLKAFNSFRSTLIKQNDTQKYLEISFSLKD